MHDFKQMYCICHLFAIQVPFWFLTLEQTMWLPLCIKPLKAYPCFKISHVFDYACTLSSCSKMSYLVKKLENTIISWQLDYFCCFFLLTKAFIFTFN